MKKLNYTRNETITEKLKTSFCSGVFSVLFVLKKFFQKIYHKCALGSYSKTEHDEKIQEATQYINKGKKVEKYGKEIVEYVKYLEEKTDSLEQNNEIYQQIIRDLFQTYETQDFEEMKVIFKDLGLYKEKVKKPTNL